MSIVDDSYDLNEPFFKNHSYLEWLESFTIDETQDEHRRPEYHLLIRKLWQIPYYGRIGNDKNREVDGLDLRTRYNSILAKNSGIEAEQMPDVHALFGECRVLEMLIALSMHMYDFMQDMGVYNSVSRWFWEIIQNIGLDWLDDDCYEDEHGDDFVNKTINDILEGVGKKGRPGGWFWVKNWQNLEVWYQMHEYLGKFFW